MNIPKPGDTLKNGATCIAAVQTLPDRAYVLAIIKAQEAQREYVTWEMNPEQDIFNGYYFHSNDRDPVVALRKATDDLVNRAEIDVWARAKEEKDE